MSQRENNSPVFAIRSFVDVDIHLLNLKWSFYESIKGKVFTCLYFTKICFEVKLHSSIMLKNHQNFAIIFSSYLENGINIDGYRMFHVKILEEENIMNDSSFQNPRKPTEDCEFCIIILDLP